MKLNDIVFDSQAKEYVIVSNGIPIKNSAGEETSSLIPTEAIALRVGGFTNKGKLIIAFTYRKVEVGQLSSLETPSCLEWMKHILSLPGETEHYRFIGRV